MFLYVLVFSQSGGDFRFIWNGDLSNKVSPLKNTCFDLSAVSWCGGLQVQRFENRLKSLLRCRLRILFRLHNYLPNESHACLRLFGYTRNSVLPKNQNTLRMHNSRLHNCQRPSGHCVCDSRTTHVLNVYRVLGGNKCVCVCYKVVLLSNIVVVVRLRRPERRNRLTE